MNQTSPNLARLARTLGAQLRADLLLGGRWLPIQAISLQTRAPAASPRNTKRAAAPPLLKQPPRTIAPTPSSAPPQETSMPQPPTASPVLEAKRQKLGEIAARVAQCTKCELSQTRTNTVPGQGNPDARLVFVGEGPGQSEDEQGLAFVGRAGQLLTKIIEAMGLTRDDVHILNIIKCRPPGNRDPQASEIMACSPYLYEQLEIIDPEIIVALGTHAAKTLLETTTPIGQLRGRFHEYQPGPLSKPIKLLATYHPAYLLRNYSQENRRRVWDDMQKVLRELGLPIPSRRGAG